ncbi:MAG: hypothetical protein KC731_22565 [Myxococcales bacterium]|nr:hypothetical protein [Myxococcales bacterium]
MKDFDEVESALAARAALASWLTRHGITHEQATDLAETYDTVLAAMPKWLDIRGEYLRCLLAEAGDRSGVDLKKWLAQELEARFVFVEKPPRWLQSPAWPINENGPMRFLGQLAAGDSFHDMGSVYVFIDPATAQVETVIQFR